MINEHSPAQTNNTTTNTTAPSSANMQYGYPPSPFDFMNVPPIQNPADHYSYYPPSLYQPFSTYNEHNQWGSNDTSTGIPSPAPGPLQYHPQLYTPTGLDMSRNTFDYPPTAYPHYHPGFGALSPGSSPFAMSWNPHNLPIQPQMTPIGGNNSVSNNKKSSIYNDYSSQGGNVGEMLAQHMNAVDLGNNYDNDIHNLSSNEQRQYQPNSTNLSFTRPSGPKSYASVVSSDTINTVSNKSTPSRAYPQQIRNQTRDNHSRYQQSSNNENTLHWTNNNNSERSIRKPPQSMNGNNQENPNEFNPKDFNLNPKGARFFVIKSYSEDDIHRSIKYNIWCSTEHGNKRLDSAFREREGKGPIYLFYSVNASGHFCGMAEMMSPLDYEHQTDVWHMSNKWQGKFEVKWIYVKDVPNQQFRNIRLENNENKPVTNSRDTQEIPYEKGTLMLKTLHMYRHKTSLFDDFQYYESKQADEVTTKIPTNTDYNRRQVASNRSEQQQQEEDD